MTVELKVFSCLLEPKGKAKKYNLSDLTTSVKAMNKSGAEAIITGKLAEFLPEHVGNYFKPKIWEDRPGIPCPPIGDFMTDFFCETIKWDEEKGEPYLTSSRQLDSTPPAPPAEEMKSLASSGTRLRSFALVMYGACDEITESQYNYAIDMAGDDDGDSPTHELGEAISRDPRVLQLHPEKQNECLAWVRSKAKIDSQWTDYKKLITTWLDTPPAQRKPVKLNSKAPVTGEETHTESGCTLGGGNTTDRTGPHNLSTLRLETCIGILAIAMDFDIYELPHAIHERAKQMEAAGTDGRFNAWWKQFRRTVGILDYSRAAIIALIKASPEAIYTDPVALREYINKHLTESDHAKPDPLLVDIACGRTSAPLPQKSKETETNDETEQALPGETTEPATTQQGDDELRHKMGLQLAHQRGECIPELGDNPADPEWGKTVTALRRGEEVSVNFTASNEGEKPEVEPTSNVQIQEVKRNEKPAGTPLPPGEGDLDDGKAPDASVNDFRPLPNDRDIEIAFALNDLLSGRTDVMSLEMAAGVVSRTGHLTPHVFPLLIADIAMAEFFLSPDFSDKEIHRVATTILDLWSDSEHVRQQAALDAIVVCRKPPTVHLPESANQMPEPTPAPFPAASSYRQQLTLAALQGMCANPAYRGDFDELPQMAIMLAAEVINAEAAQ
ncbi:hypothetical protein [Kluyvera intermedia]|uniref:hypothetical protein n=1 Tax=Kluyvera intermedia TaxID=61648 RepID=UPI0035268D72